MVSNLNEDLEFGVATKKWFVTQQLKVDKIVTIFSELSICTGFEFWLSW